MRLGPRTLLAPLAVVAGLAGGCGDDRIADGVRVATVDVGGLDAEAARERVERRLRDAVGRPVAVTYRNRRFVLRPDLAGARVDADASVQAAARRDGGVAALRVSYDRDNLDGFVTRVARRVELPARDADIDVRDGKLSRARARNGVEVKRSALHAQLVRAMSDPVPARRKVALIAVGRQGLESSPGRYKIEEKIVDPPWHAPDKAWAGELAGQTIAPGDPRNPLVARWMGYHDGEGIHGTKDVESLGTQASHGCIRMSPRAVKQLFSRVKVGTPVFLQ